MQKNNRKKRNNKGFSMVELIIVIAIMAALVGILAPQYIKYVERSRLAADQKAADELLTATKIAVSDPDAHFADETYRVVWTKGGALNAYTGATGTTTNQTLLDLVGASVGATATGSPATYTITDMKSSTHQTAGTDYVVTVVVGSGSATATGTW